MYLWSQHTCKTIIWMDFKHFCTLLGFYNSQYDAGKLYDLLHSKESEVEYLIKFVIAQSKMLLQT